MRKHLFSFLLLMLLGGASAFAQQFHYQLSRSTTQERQQVHEAEQIIYVNLGNTAAARTVTLRTTMNRYPYYRWYTMTDAGAETSPTYLTPTNTGGNLYTLIERTRGNILFRPLNAENVANTENGRSATYTVPNNVPANTFFNSPQSVIYCDQSMYQNYSLTGTIANGTFLEPTISFRNKFVLRPASEIAAAPAEYYDIDAPCGTTTGVANGTRIRIAPKYAANNYFIANGANYSQGAFRWYRITENQTAAGQGTQINPETDAGDALTADYFHPNGNTRYLQIRTTNKAIGSTEYYALDVHNSNTVRKRVAIYKITYRSRQGNATNPAVGPKIIDPATADIFDHIAENDKKLIVEKSFDQTEAILSKYNPANTPGASPDDPTYPLGNTTPFSAYRMGTLPLDLDESSYGFTSPLYYTGTNYQNLATGPGVRARDHYSPFWNEYGFPQQINGLTAGYGWWNNGEVVNDISYLKEGVRGNMLYVDAADFEGTFSTLNFNESFCAGAKLYFSMWVANLNYDSRTSTDIGTSASKTRPNLVMVLKTINDNGEETVVKRFYTGDIGYGADNTSRWFQIGFDFLIPKDLEGDFRLEIQNNGISSQGNDFALDNIQIYRTNPSIKATRTNEIFCIPENGEIAEDEPLEMEVELNLSQLWPDNVGSNPSLYFRFLDAQEQAFPRFQEGKQATSGTPMYVNNSEENGQYWYGRIDLNTFTRSTPLPGDAAVTEPNGRYDIRYPDNLMYRGMYTYRQGSATGNLVLLFSQRIPASVLNDGVGGNDFNVGTYHIYVGESAEVLADPICSGEAEFAIKFDKTDFEMTIAGSSAGGGSGELSICTNNSIDIKAYAIDPNNDEVKMFAFYDWYRGPMNTQPAEVIGSGVIRNKTDFDAWLDTPEGEAWLAGEGEEWTWGKPNYVGFNQYGGYFDGSSISNTGDSDFRTLKKDLKAYRFFYPYQADLTELGTEIETFPVDYRNEAVMYIDYTTGAYYANAAGTILIDDNYSGVDALRFTANSYKNWGSADYITDYQGNSILENGEEIPYINDLDDLNDLLERLRHYQRVGLVKLYKDRIDEEIRSLANYYLTVIPTDLAFEVPNNNVNIPIEELDMSKAKAICTTPAEVVLKANNWSPEAKFGEVNDEGTYLMPYGEIDDSDFDHAYVYTVRLPERDFNKTLTTTQFVAPLLYFEGIKNARIRLTGVINEAGVAQTITNGSILNEAYIGLIDPNDPNKLATGVTVPITNKYNVATGERVNLTGGDPRTLDVRWRVNSARSAFFALESYPLTHNKHNYFFNDPVNNDLELEGAPLAISTEIGNSTVENNNIALGIMASDEQLRSFTTTIDNQAHFIPGYTYSFTLEGTGANAWQESECDLNLEFCLKVVPDTIIWNGETNPEEWNMDMNWYIPTEVNGKYSATASANETFPPLPETKVIIPAGLGQYSTLEEYPFLIGTGYDTNREIISVINDLGTYVQVAPNKIHTTPWIEFDYNYRPNSCDTIHFKHGGLTDVAGGELARTDLLKYNAAKVDLDIETQRWYGLSAPLRQVYTGDYMFEKANPVTSRRVFNTASPQSGEYKALDWSTQFNNSDIELPPGFGYTVKVGALYYMGEISDEGINSSNVATGYSHASFHFPRHDERFQFYHQTTKAKDDKIEPENGVLDRRYGYRFIYEITPEGTTNSIVPANPIINLELIENIVEGGQTVVVGNPFMAHLDFEAFYYANQEIIKPEFKLISGLKGDKTITVSATDNNGKLTNVVSSDPEGLGLTSLAPMQTFILTTKEGYTRDAGAELKITKEMSVVDAGTVSRLRSSGVKNSVLHISAEGSNGNLTQAALAFSESSDNAYKLNEDSHRMIINKTKDVPYVFTIADGMYLDINRMHSFPEAIPVGVIGGKQGTITIRIEGTHSLNIDKDIYFLDQEKELSYLLNGETFEYTFDHDTTDKIGRFYLISKASQGPTDLDEIDKAISVYTQDQMIHILSLTGEEIEEVEVIGLDGQSWYQESHIGKSYLQIPTSLFRNPVLIVKVRCGKTTQAAKVIIR